jgi:hypothetical protein
VVPNGGWAGTVAVVNRFGRTAAWRIDLDAPGSAGGDGSILEGRTVFWTPGASPALEVDLSLAGETDSRPGEPTKGAIRFGGRATIRDSLNDTDYELLLVAKNGRGSGKLAKKEKSGLGREIQLSAKVKSPRKVSLKLTGFLRDGRISVTKLKVKTPKGSYQPGKYTGFDFTLGDDEGNPIAVERVEASGRVTDRRSIADAVGEPSFVVASVGGDEIQGFSPLPFSAKLTPANGFGATLSTRDDAREEGNARSYEIGASLSWK